MAIKGNSLNPDNYEEIFKALHNTKNLSDLNLNENKEKEKKLFTKISILIVSLKFLWFVGHVIVVYNTIINCTLAKINPNYVNSYHKALVGVIISNGILIYKTHGIPDFASSWFENICKDQNFHYLLLAFIFNFTKPLFFILYPFCIYSIFHMANFIYAEILSSHPEKPIAMKTLNFIKRYQETMIKKVAQFEIVIVFPMMFVAAVCRQASLLAVLFYGRFLYIRYCVSPEVRNLWKEIRISCENTLESTDEKEESSSSEKRKNIKKYIKFAYYTLVYIFEDFFIPMNQISVNTENTENEKEKENDSDNDSDSDNGSEKEKMK